MDAFDADREIAQELEPGERLIWSGVPKQGLRLRASDALLIPFSLLWGGFAIFWEANVLVMGAPWFFAVWGIPFICIGLYLIVGRLFFDAWRRAKTAYGLTERRAIIVSGTFSRTIRSLPLSGLNDVSLATKGDGSGTISFGSAPWMGWPTTAGWPTHAGQFPTCFEWIDNARDVYAKLLAARSTP